MKILITGKNGYIGRNLSKKLNLDITSVGREDFDLTDRESTNNWFKDKYFDVVIHTAILGGSRLKQDNETVFFQNLSMFYNLLYNQDKFSQVISLGSGAELGYPTDYYGLSKNIIHRIIQDEPQFNNLRIFAVFNEDELDSRFIKANIKRYINKEPLIIHQNKVMDFFYMDDLVSLVKETILYPQLKTVNCCYDAKYSLLDIAHTINGLSDYKCEIQIDNKSLGKPYIGQYEELNIKYIGLYEGIKRTYNKLLHEY